MSAYPDQKEKLEYLMKRGDQRNIPDWDKLIEPTKKQFSEDYLDIKDYALAKCLHGEQRFPETKIGHPRSYKRDEENKLRNKEEHGLLVEFAGIDTSEAAIMEFHRRFREDAVAAFIKFCEDSPTVQAPSPAPVPSIRPAHDSVLMSTLFQQALTDGCGAIKAEPHRPAQSMLRPGFRFHIPAHQVEREAQIAELSAGKPAWLEFTSPVQRNGQTSSWSGWSIMLLEREVDSERIGGILPGAVDGRPGWRVTAFPSTKRLALPTHEATAESGWRWQPDAKEIGPTFEIACIATKLAVPDEIRSRITFDKQPETAPVYRDLATWLASEMGEGRAGLVKLSYRVVA